jgi:hypothetical protein
MPRVSEIAAEAFDAVAVEVPGVIQACTVTRSLNAYDPASGAMSGGSPSEDSADGRCVWASIDAVRDIFPSLEISDADALVYAIELSMPPREGDTFAAGGRRGQVLAVRDILNTAELFALVIR